MRVKERGDAGERSSVSIVPHRPPHDSLSPELNAVARVAPGADRDDGVDAMAAGHDADGGLAAMFRAQREDDEHEGIVHSDMTERERARLTRDFLFAVGQASAD